MKWQIPTKAKLGDIREVEKFALLPTRCDAYNGQGSFTQYRVWLEHYIEYQKYLEIVNGDLQCEEAWVAISKNVIKKG
jgi:uncharacterized protein YxeA